MKDTQQTQPTDTEMLDWMILNSARLQRIVGSCYITYSKTSSTYYSKNYKTPRQAIAAEMMKENK